MISFAVFDKICARFYKTKSHVGGNTFGMQFFNPVKQAGARTVIIFAAGNNLLNLPGSQISGNAYFADERGGHNSLMLEREFQQQRNTFVRHFLIFAGNVEKNIFPAVIPIRRQTCPYPLGTFGQQKKDNVRTLLYYPPGFRTPAVGFGQKKSDVMQTRICSPLFTL